MGTVSSAMMKTFWRWIVMIIAILCVCVLVTQSCLTPCDPMNQALPSMEFSRQEYWSGLPFPSPNCNLKND